MMPGIMECVARQSLRYRFCDRRLQRLDERELPRSTPPTATSCSRWLRRQGDSGYLALSALFPVPMSRPSRNRQRLDPHVQGTRLSAGARDSSRRRCTPGAGQVAYAYGEPRGGNAYFTPGPGSTAVNSLFNSVRCLCGVHRRPSRRRHGRFTYRGTSGGLSGDSSPSIREARRAQSGPCPTTRASMSAL